jgi:serine/threonine protein kinase
MLHRACARAPLVERVRLTSLLCLQADFGMAKVHHINPTTNILETVGKAPRGGTLTYMAPEQYVENMRGKREADVYAMAITAWEVSAGNTHTSP